MVIWICAARALQQGGSVWELTTHERTLASSRVHKWL